MESIQSRLADAQVELERVNALVAESQASGQPTSAEVKAAIQAIAETAGSLLQEALTSFKQG